jgi:hypothetical protein
MLSATHRPLQQHDTNRSPATAAEPHQATGRPAPIFLRKVYRVLNAEPASAPVAWSADGQGIVVRGSINTTMPVCSTLKVGRR